MVFPKICFARSKSSLVVIFIFFSVPKIGLTSIPAECAIATSSVADISAFLYALYI